MKGCMWSMTHAESSSSTPAAIGCLSANSDNHQLHRQQFTNTTAYDEGETKIAKEMNELSVQEREKVYDDIHGVAQIHQETPEFIDQCFQEMDDVLSKASRAKRRAWERALFFKPTLQTNTKFKCMFLRADNYHPNDAANRMLKYFEEKRFLFGENKLGNTITLNDLNEQDKQVLSSGPFIMLPKKDQAGRPIFFKNVSKVNFDCEISEMRCLWYLIMSALEEEETQMKGICHITYCPGNISLPPSVQKLIDKMHRGRELISALPFRSTSYHFCFNNTSMQFLLSAARIAIGKSIRLRLRAHYGSDIEIQYSLLTFGIQAKSVFQDDNHHNATTKINSDFIKHRWTVEQQQRELMEREERQSKLILHPNSNDVLVGRGRPYQNFRGNQRLTQLVESHMQKYLDINDRAQRSCIFVDVIREIHGSNGRFLCRVPNGWEIAEERVAREKVSGCFRSKAAREKDASVVGETRSPTTMTTTAEEATFESLEAPSKRLRYDSTFVMT